jgi:hypothetical protein
VSERFERHIEHIPLIYIRDTISKILTVGERNICRREFVDIRKYEGAEINQDGHHHVELHIPVWLATMQRWPVQWSSSMGSSFPWKE